MSASLPGGAWAREGLEPCFAADAVVLDVDGVLVDVRASFREAVRVSVREVQRLIGVARPWTPSHADIAAFKRARGFNDDIDTAIALTAIGAAGQGSRAATIAAAVEERGGGLGALRAVAPELPRVEGRSVLRVFDEAYWGRDGFAETFGAAAEHVQPGPGLIEQERPLVPRDWPGQLRAHGVTRIGLVTGRTAAELAAALDRLGWSEDDLDACVTGEQVRKPDPGCLDAVVLAQPAHAAVYVGDVRDDWELVRRYRAERPGGVPIRCVIVGDRREVGAYRALGVDATLHRATDLTGLLDAWRQSAPRTISTSR